MQRVTLLGERAARLPAGPVESRLQRRHVVHRAARRGAAAARARSARRFFTERLDASWPTRRARLVAADPDARMTGAASRIADLAARARARLRAHRGCTGAALRLPAPVAPRRSEASATADGGQPRVVDGVEDIEGEGPDAALRRQALHPLALLRHLRDRRCSSRTSRARGSIPTRCRSMRWSRSRTPARRARSAIGARTAMPDEQRAAGESPADARSRPVRRARRTCCSTASRSAIARRCAAAAPRRTSRSATARTTRSASPRRGEPPSGKTDMLEVRDGALAIDPQRDGPLQGARQSRDHQRHRTRRRARAERAAVPLRRAATTSRSATTATCAWGSRARREAD